MHLKESAYNFIYDDLGKDQIVFYNSRTGALAVVHEDQYKQYKGFQEKGKEIEDAEFLKNLLKCGYLLPAEVDEKFLIKTNMMQGRYNKNLLSLTIAPTMACNFRCIYCFEKGHYGNSLMDGETQIALMNFIKSHLDGVKNINVTWFGGEPLLGMSVIESLSEQIIALCEEKELQYQAGIITNGYLLTPENAEKLKKYNVRYAQVTVDGPKEIHNERRPTVNGQGTYDVIMNNLKSILKINDLRLADGLEMLRQGLGGFSIYFFVGSAPPCGQLPGLIIVEQYFPEHGFCLALVAPDGQTCGDPLDPPLAVGIIKIDHEIETSIRSVAEAGQKGVTSV